MKTDTKWKLITAATHIVCLTVGIAIVFLLSVQCSLRGSIPAMSFSGGQFHML